MKLLSGCDPELSILSSFWGPAQYSKYSMLGLKAIQRAAAKVAEDAKKIITQLSVMLVEKLYIITY
jgi:hypothetical protein